MSTATQDELAGLVHRVPAQYVPDRIDLDAFPDNGCANLGQMLDTRRCAELRAWIDARRPVKPEIFHPSAEAFMRNGRWIRYSPGPGYNLLEGEDLGFIENDEQFVELLTRLAGPDYSIMKKAAIRSVPATRVPDWVAAQVADVGRPNLNPFVLDEYQDVQYFLCTDFHQDKTRAQSHFITVYIYLDSVKQDYSPLVLLKGSHVHGMTSYPHSLRRSKTNRSIWFYSNGHGGHIECEESLVLGDCGSVACFHGLTLHGTSVNNDDDPRISLRYLIAPDPSRQDQTTLFDQANQRVTGPMDIDMYRVDIAEDGSYLPTGSSLEAHR